MVRDRERNKRQRQRQRERERSLKVSLCGSFNLKHRMHRDSERQEAGKERERW